jgi:hypothetical protein
MSPARPKGAARRCATGLRPAPDPGRPIQDQAATGAKAALYASRPASPDYAYFCGVRDRIDGQRALLSVARKLVRRCYHTLRDLGEDALAPAA